MPPTTSTAATTTKSYKDGIGNTAATALGNFKGTEHLGVFMGHGATALDATRPTSAT